VAAGGQTKEQSEELTFGRHLKMLRTQKGLDLNTVSDETKILASTLRLIEEEAFDQLPDNVFVKGFLRAYAGVVEAPTDLIIQNFLAGRHHFEEVRRFEAGLSKSRRFFRLRLLLAVVLLAVLTYGVVLSLKNRSMNPPPDSDVRQTEDTADSKTEVPLTATSQQPVETQEPGDAYLLQVNAVEETWMKIIVDRKDPKEYLLNPGDHLEIKATSGFNLLIGNATGINLQFNDRPIAIEGRHGQVVTLKLP
jgi:cytoskeletal protein RodZ